MDEASRQYLEAMEAMFATVGWKFLMSDIAGFKEAISSQWRSATPDGLRFAQGRYDGLNQISEYETMLETLKAQSLRDALDVETI
jgi:hypothetical protein